MIFDLELSLKPDYLIDFSGSSEILLHEEKEGYTFAIKRIKEDSKIVGICNIEDLKHQYLYTKTRDNSYKNPKDCDYILINEESKDIYFIELKKNSGSIEGINEQLSAGEVWLNHILFCAERDIKELESFNKHRICLRYTEGPFSTKSRSYQTKKGVGDKIYYEFRGKEITYSKLKSQTLNNIN
ncbi:hypothetical protein [Lactococcus lactis]|uniref:hypothetical protein n=1 Tax=Lactococcus lactis TaxID=1358 RepID=UPI003D2BD33F